MRISFITMNRIVEEEAAKDEEVRRRLQKNGKTVLSHGRALSDEALLDKLRSLNLPLDRDRFRALSQPFFSAEEMARSVLENRDLPTQWDEDWVWIAYVCLWERWQPERPSLEMLDDWMQAGYKAQERGEPAEASRLWQAVWDRVLALSEGLQIRSISAFDERFPMTQCVFNWVQDFILALYNAGLDDPSFFRKRLEVLETLLGRFHPEDLLLANSKNDLAETYFLVGMPEKGEQLYRRWLHENPRWGWGWIGWSDCYGGLGRQPARDPARAEEILMQGLAVPGVEDREDLLQRLADLYEDTGRVAEAQVVQAEIDRLAPPARTLPAPVPVPTPAPAPPAPRLPGRTMPLPSPARRLPPKPVKVGRNDPCPCGSGKKFKRCCGRNVP